MEAQCCRCCLTTESENYYNLFENYKSTRSYAENIYQLTEVYVELDDGLPQHACGKCFIELNNVIEFVSTIRQCDEKLRRNLHQTPQPINENKDEEAVEAQFVLGEDSVYYGEGQEHLNTLEEEVLHTVDETFRPPTDEVTIVEEYVKEDSTEDLQMVEEILEYDEEIPNDTVTKEIDPLHELAQIAATQENVHVDPNSQEFYSYPEDECDDEYLIEYNPKEEPNLNLKPSKWKCVECKIILRGDVSYEGHMNIHRNTRPHKCTQCSCQFRCRNAFKKHKENRHTKHTLQEGSKIEEISIVQMRCSNCNQICQTEVDLLRHEIIAHDKHSQTTCCPLCPDVAVENLLNHLQSEHSDVTEVSQDEGAVTKTILETLPCVTISFYNCHLCSKRFNSLLALNNHRNLHHSADNAQVVSSPSQITSWHCDICTEAYDTLSALNEHWKLCHDEDNTDVFVMEEYDEYSNTLESLVQCEICKKKLQKKNLSKHMAAHKRKDKEATEQTPSKLLCAFCPREFKNSKTLNQHERTHKGESDDTDYVCVDCLRQYSSRILLESHRKHTHKDRDHVCNICGNAFKLKNQLMNHMKLHLEKNIQCPHCEKKYARQFDLNVHLRSHTGEMPYACHLCDKRFAIKVRLTYHLQKHYGVKHQCKDCHAEFNSRQKLKYHTFKHTGMPYRCELCDDHGFPNRVAFKRHLDRVHHASMTDDALSEMFQRNTGKTIKIEQVSDSYMVASPECVEIEEEIV